MKQPIKNTMLYWWDSCKGFMKINYITIVKISTLKLVPMYFGLGLRIFICLVFSEKAINVKFFSTEFFFMPLYMPDLKFLIWKLNVPHTKIPWCYWHYIFGFLKSRDSKKPDNNKWHFFPLLGVKEYWASQMMTYSCERQQKWEVIQFLFSLLMLIPAWK